MNASDRILCNKEKEKEKQNHPHALVCPWPAQGHVNPFLNLTSLLASKGIAVTFISPEHLISPLLQDQSLLTNPLINLVGLPERVPPPAEGASISVVVDNNLTRLYEVAENMKDDVLKLMRFRQDTAAAAHISIHSNYCAPDCVIADPCLPWFRDVASILSIPLYFLYTSSCRSLTPAFYRPILVSQGLIPLRSSAQPQLVSLPGLPPLWDKDLFDPVGDDVHARIPRGISDSAMQLSQSSRILVNATYEIESDSIDALQKEDPYKTNVKIQAIGPLIRSELLDKDHAQHSSLQIKHENSEVRDCLQWLNTQSPASVLYVAFGSLYIASENEISEFAHGLEGSTHAFLWVLRPSPSHSSQNARSWLSRILPQGFQSRTQNRGYILPHWAPQPLILSNPAIGGFLTHCGWNSIGESICCSVPLIAYPKFAEQRHNCRMIVDQLKIGIELEKNESKGFSERKAVERAVISIMNIEESHKMRREIAQLRDTIIMGVKENGSSYRNIESIVEEIFDYFTQKSDIADNING